MNNFNFRDRRPIIGIVVAVLIVLGVIGISNASYQNGVMQGMLMGNAQGTQIVVPNANGDGTQVIPAPAAPRGPAYGYPAPYGQRGFGIFGLLGGLFRILLIGGIILFVSRLLFRGFGRGRWGRGWGSPGVPSVRGFGGSRGPWGRGSWDRGGDDGQRDDDKPNTGVRDGDVI